MSAHSLSLSLSVYSCDADHVIRELLSEVAAGGQWGQETEYGVWSLQEVSANVLFGLLLTFVPVCVLKP